MRGGEESGKEEEILTHIRWVDWEDVGSEMTGNFWILGERELVGELLFIYLDLRSIAGARGCGAGDQGAQASLLPDRPNRGMMQPGQRAAPLSLQVSPPSFASRHPEEREWAIGSEFGEGAE